MPIREQDIIGMTPEQIRARYSPQEIMDALRESGSVASGLPEVADESGVGFFDRAKVSFGGNAGERENILRTQGYLPARTASGELGVVKDGKIYPVDEESVSLSDFADMAGSAPATIMGSVGAFGGLAATPVGSAAAATAGSAAGDVARQYLGRAFGSGQTDLDWGDVAIEGAMGLVGEGVGRGLGKVLSGPFRRATDAPDFRRTMDAAGEFDTRYGTNIQGMAPADVQADSDFLAQASQRIRESQFGGQALREGQDVPLRREVSRGFDKIVEEGGAAGPGGTPGPFSSRTGRSQAGRDLKEAASDAVSQRRGEQSRLFDEFRGQIDETAVPTLSNTDAALREIDNTNILRRQKTGSQGLDILRGAMDEANGIRSFDDLVTLRQAVQDEIDNFDPTRMNRGVQAQLQRLRGALRADEDAFLEAGGGVGSDMAASAGRRAREYSKSLYDLDESSIVRDIFKDDLKLGDIPNKLRNRNVDEVRALRQFVGAESGAGGLQATARGMETWNGIGREVLEDLRQAATNTDLSTGDEWVLSGAKLTSALQRYKEGVLEEILGPEVTQSLRQLADVAKGTSLAERGFANTSRSGAANATVLNDLLDFFRGRPMRATGSILGRFFAERGAGKVLGSEGGKRYLLGQLPWQAGNETVFGAIGRLGGQSAVRGTVAGVKDRR